MGLAIVVAALAVLALITQAGVVAVQRAYPAQGRMIEVAGAALNVLEIGPRDAARHAGILGNIEDVGLSVPVEIAGVQVVLLGIPFSCGMTEATEGQQQYPKAEDHILYAEFSLTAPYLH